MSFPAPYKPKIIHLWLNDTAHSVFGSQPVVGNTSNQNALLQLCKDSCVNTFTMYEIPTITQQTTALGNFICNAKSNYGICTVAGVVNPYDWYPAPPGTKYEQFIRDYNFAVSNDPCRRIDYLTLECEFWNLDVRNLNPIISGTNCTITVNANATTGVINSTSSTCIGTSTNLPGMLIAINVAGTYVIRQITSIVGSILTFDRPFDNLNAISAPYYVIDNRAFYALDFETFLVRVRDNIRPMAILNNLLPLEMYISRRLTNDQYERIVPHIDRLLIEEEYDVFDYPLYNDPLYNTVRNVLSACSVTRTGTINIAPNTNLITGVGTLFTRDLGVKSKIVINSSEIYTIDSIINDTSALIVGTSPGIISGTYATYFDFAPMFYIATGSFGSTGYPLRQNWLVTPPAPQPFSKSYADVYRFHTQSSYVMGSANQSANNVPRAFNDEMSFDIQSSANAIGLSIYMRNGFEYPAVSNNVRHEINCPTCTGDTIHCEVTGQTFSNCLVATFTNPDCDCLCNGTISGFTSYGTPPFVYYVTGSTTSVIFTSNTGYFTGLCADIYALCVTDSTNLTACYYLPITISNTFYAKITTYLNGFCITISGGTLPYNITKDGNPLPWNDNNGLGITTNCYTADCNTQSVIVVTDSSPSTVNLCL